MTAPSEPEKSWFMKGLLIAALILVLDQLTKQLILNYFNNGGQEIAVLPFFNIVMVWNYGISFGMFSELKIPVVLITLSTSITLILLIWLRKTTDTLVGVALGFIIGGAIGNIIDRFRFGAVADFLDFHVSGWHWPAFNIADSTIFIGVVLLCFHSMFMDHNRNDKGTSS